MRLAICPGSFDPITLGHLDLIERAARLFDEVIVLVLSNGEKDRGMFTPGERLRLCEKAVSHLPNVRADLFDGLLAVYAKEKGAVALVKGVRTGTDYDWEYQMAWINDGLYKGLETVLLPASPTYCFFSSTMAREMIRHHQDLTPYLPQAVVEELEKGNDYAK